MRSLLAWGREVLGRAGLDHPEDAATLLAHVLGVERSRLVLVHDVTGTESAEYTSLVLRRAEREPLQHLTGKAGFRYLDLYVGAGVFVPRPETELLAGWAIDHAARVLKATGQALVVDLCAGSGAIGGSVAQEVPGVDVIAVEKDPAAFAWLERNLAASAVELRLGDMADAVEDLVGRVDIVVCNPPYIPLEAWESVQIEARDHDPDMALFSGADGLKAIRVLEQVASRVLRPGGLVGVEHAEAQAVSAPQVFSTAGRWAEIRDHLDLSERPRYLTARLAHCSP